MAQAVILGSAFSQGKVGELELIPEEVMTSFGTATLHRVKGKDAWVLFRHGAPHRYLPNQIPYRAHAAALRSVGCQALLVTSSVGVLDLSIPLDKPLWVQDLMMPENRLPDGSACSMFVLPSFRQGHLVLEDGLFSSALRPQVEELCLQQQWPLGGEVVFAYVGGPRTKTAAENKLWAQWGAQVNSMTLGPEVVLANELEIPTAAVVVGHKYSVPGHKDPLDKDSISASLQRSHEALEQLVVAFLRDAKPVPFANRIYRFDHK
jgi:5'-methylthioadenosine phosphorylase